MKYRRIIVELLLSNYCQALISLLKVIIQYIYFRRGMFSATLGQEVQGWCKLK